jgi:hypothetical protein
VIEMRVRRKVVHQLLLSPREIESLIEMIHEAKEGRTVHASERETSPGQFFGIGVDDRYDSLTGEPQRPEPRPMQYK